MGGVGGMNPGCQQVTALGDLMTEDDSQRQARARRNGLEKLISALLKCLWGPQTDVVA